MSMLTRKQVAQRIGRSVTTVRRMEGDNLHPIVDTDGVHWFDEEDVDVVAKEIVQSGRALPRGTAKEAVELARKEKQELVDDLEFAQSTISMLRQQILALQTQIDTLRSNNGIPRSSSSVLVSALNEDLEHLIRQIQRPSFQTELVATRMQSTLRSLSLY